MEHYRGIAGQKSARRGAGRLARKSITVVAAVAATFGGVWAFYQATMAPAPLETMIPDSTVAFGSADARWFWDNTADLRRGPEVQKGLAQAEKEMKLSIGRDIVPWAGQVAGALLSVDGRKPQGAFFIEVRNPVEYYATMSRLRSRLEGQASRYWKPAVYSGVPLRYTYVGPKKFRTAVSTAWLKGWVVVGVGDGATKKIIDVWQGRKLSIQRNAAWSPVIAKLPENRVTWGGINTGALLDVARTVGMPMANMDESRAVAAGAMTDLEDGFRVVSATAATSPKARALYTKLGDTLPPVTTDIIDQLPDGTFVSCAISNPAGWYDVYLPLMKQAMQPEPKAKKAMDQGLAELKPLETIIRRCRNGMALGATYVPQKGFGVVIAADCGTPEAARQSAEDIDQFAQKHKQSVTVSEDRSTYSLLGKEQTGTPFALKPSWSVNGSFLTFASHEQWLHPATGLERMPLPAEAEGAQVVAQGDFRFVEPLMQQAPSPSPAKTVGKATGKGKLKKAVPITKDAAIKDWQRSGLADARWRTWSTIRSEGRADGVFELRNWPWRSVMKSIADQQQVQARGKTAKG